MTALTNVVPGFWHRRGPVGFFRPLFKTHSYVERRKWSPLADLAESDKEYVFTLEIPGVDRDSLDVSYTDGVVTVKGEKKKEDHEGECCHCSERYSGSFERSFRVPGKVDEEGKATFKDGVLKIAFTKLEDKGVKRIEVK